MVRHALALVAALALATGAHAAPTSDGMGQLVFGSGAGQYEEVVPVPSAPAASASREPDFIDVLMAEAEAAGKEVDFGLPHTAQKAQEGAKAAALASQEAEEEWGTLLPDGDLAELSDAAEAAEHAAELYAAQIAKYGKDALEGFSLKFAPLGSTKAASAQGSPSAKAEPGSGWVWKTCGGAQDAVEVKSVDVTPDPPKPGQNMTVHGTGMVHSLIDEGSYVDVVVKIGVIKLLSRRFDLCAEAANANAQVQCPIAPGEYDIEQTVALPREIPPAKFNVHVSGSTQMQWDLTCLDLSINFMHR